MSNKELCKYMEESCTNCFRVNTGGGDGAGGGVQGLGDRLKDRVGIECRPEVGDWESDTLWGGKRCRSSCYACGAQEQVSD